MSTPYLLPHLLTASADRRPEAVAVRLQDRALTYGEVETESNRLAHALIGLGIKPGEQVAIHLEKSFGSIIGVFGIMKAGASYVPIEPNAPAARVLSIVDQCTIRCMLVSRQTVKKLNGATLGQSPVRTVIVVDGQREPTDTGPTADSASTPVRVSLSEVLAVQPTHLPCVGGIDRDLAYVLFTSGSTGVPKGVMLSHRSALTFVDWACDTFQLGPEDRLSNHAPLNFDLSIFDIFAGIKAGAGISLIPERLSPFPLLVSELLEQDGLTVWYSVPSVLTMMLLNGKLAARDLSRLRLVLFAGEVFPPVFLRQVMAAIPAARFFNLYGPTETNVCTYFQVGTVPDSQQKPVAIGRACANTEVIAIAESGEIVSGADAQGLLYVRGSTVMDGYYGRPQETSDAYRVHPLPGRGEQKLYCTGDWVTMDDNGNYHLLGRRDDMVKTRGYRVELGEIESVLYSYPDVLEAVALAVPHEQFGNTIRASIVFREGGTGDTIEIKRFCAGKLPHYMIPEEIDIRAALPHTVTGKIDRSQLRTEMEEKVIG